MRWPLSRPMSAPDARRKWPVTAVGHRVGDRSREVGTSIADVGPGLVVAVAIALLAVAVHDRVELASAHVVSVGLALVIGNLGLLPVAARPGLAFASKHVLRVGVVFVGFRLSMSDLLSLSARGLVLVVAVVATSFMLTRWVAAKLGLSRPLGLLLATGTSICGVSAIAAAAPAVRPRDDELAYAIGLVTLCGTLAIGLVPALGSILGLGDSTLGAWIGASIHDVGQVVAAASTTNERSLEIAVVVKLARVLMLAPVLAALTIADRRDPDRVGEVGRERTPLVPGFIAAFIVAVAIRSSGVMPSSLLGDIRDLETILLAAGLAGAAAGVSLNRLRRLGARPLVAGLVSWALVLIVTLVGSSLAFGA